MVDLKRDYGYVLIVGNGFDLNLGLKTSYADFINSEHFNKLLYIESNMLCHHLKQEHEYKLWIDVENELKKYSKQRTDDFENEYDHLCVALMNYMKELSYVDIDKKSNAYKLIEKIRFEDFLILDFNYTSSIREILKDFGMEHIADQRVVKVHGSVELGKIVFGIEDDVAIEADHIFLKKTCSINYIPIPFGKLMEGAAQVGFFGHSLGETDHMYFKNYFLRITNDDRNLRNITLFYYGKIGFKQLHIQLDNLTARRVGFLKQNADFHQVDVSIKESI